MADLNGVIGTSIQSQVRQEDLTGLDILPFFVRAGELLPPYWSKARDVELGRYWMKNDHVSSAFSMFASKFASIPLYIRPRDTSIKSHVKNAYALTDIVNSLSDYAAGWSASFAVRFIIDYITQDNGAFSEVLGDAPMRRDRLTGDAIRDTSKPRENFYGFAVLDSQLCQRTSSPIYPVIYRDVDGNRYKLHHTRVMYASSLPSTRVRLNRVGFCALSRLINTAQHLIDISTMEQEELGSRPKRRLIVGKTGITASEIATAFETADRSMDNQGLSRYSKSVVIAPSVKATSANPIEIDVLDLHSALQGQDKEMSITLGMFLIALALNIPPRWLWPASSTGATKADAMYQHIAGMGGGIGHIIMIMKSLMGGDTLAGVLGKAIGPEYEVVFDFQDDEQDRQQAEARKIRSETWEKNLAAGIVDTRTARQQALDAGDITIQQYEDMELADGRLPDGQDVLNLFYTTDPILQPMLSISVGDVLNPNENDKEFVLSMIEDKLIEIRATLANPARPKEFDYAKQAFAALIALKALYEGAKIAEQTQRDMATEDDLAADAETEQGKVEDKPQPMEEDIEIV